MIVLGRSGACQLLLDDPLVSRQHARLLVSNVGVLVEDLGSTNGVFVNETRISGPTALSDGDRLLIGGLSMVLRAGHKVSPTPAPVSKPRQTPVRAPGSSEPPASASPTQRSDAFETMGQLADRMLSMGKLDVAIKLMSGHLTTLVQAARQGQVISPRMRDKATYYALRLASGSGDPGYVNQALELNLICRAVLKADAIDQLARLLPQLPAIDSALFRRYAHALASLQSTLTADEMERIDRIGALAAEL